MLVGHRAPQRTIINVFRRSWLLAASEHHVIRRAEAAKSRAGCGCHLWDLSATNDRVAQCGCRPEFVRLLIPPPLDRVMSGTSLNQQRKEDVSVRLHVIQMSDVFLIEQLRELAVGANRSGVARRQFDGRLGHSLTFSARRLRQQSADGFRYQIAEETIHASQRRSWLASSDHRVSRRWFS